MSAEEIFGKELGTISPLLAEISRYSPEELSTLGGVFAETPAKDQAIRENYCRSNFNRHAPVWRKNTKTGQEQWICLDSPRLSPRPISSLKHIRGIESKDIESKNIEGKEEKSLELKIPESAESSGCCQLPVQLKTRQDFEELINVIRKNPSYRLLAYEWKTKPNLSSGEEGSPNEIGTIGLSGGIPVVYEDEQKNPKEPVDYLEDLKNQYKPDILYGYAETFKGTDPLFLYENLGTDLKNYELELTTPSLLPESNYPSRVAWLLEQNAPNDLVWNEIWKYLDKKIKRVNWLFNRHNYLSLSEASTTEVTSYDQVRREMNTLLRLLADYNRNINHILPERINEHYEPVKQKELEKEQERIRKRYEGV